MRRLLTAWLLGMAMPAHAQIVQAETLFDQGLRLCLENSYTAKMAAAARQGGVDKATLQQILTAMAASKSGDEAEVFAESKQMMVDEVYAYPVLTGQAAKQAFVEEAQTNFYQSCVTSFSQKLLQIGA